MRPSRYTVVESTGEGEHLLYNTANGAFAVLDDEAYEVWDSAGQLWGSVAQDLMRYGFLTEMTPEEELASLQARLEEHRAKHDELTLCFVPTYACNFRCPYCYEYDRTHIGGKMDGPLMDVIMDFVHTRYEQDGFEKLSVQWYGGDPSLALDVVEELSERLIAWCVQAGVAYDALMLTNANVIGPDEADIIAKSRISMLLLTIDGPEEIHNQRRVAANGTNSYQKTLEAARLLRERGVALSAFMNVDHLTWPLYTQTRDKMLIEEGIFVKPCRLCDYGHNYGTPPFAKPDFDLFTHEEFCQERLRQFGEERHSAGEMRELLRPNLQFCSGQSGNYFVIDCKGDVFDCDGWVGYPEYVKFNILDGPDAWKPSGIIFDAPRDSACSQCEQLPMCLGSCIWERTLTGMPCYPIKDHIGGYLRIYRSCFGEVGPGFTLLAEPFEM